MDLSIIAAILSFVAIAVGGLAFMGGSDSEKMGKRAREMSASAARPQRAARAANDPNAKRKAVVQDNLRELARKQESTRKTLVSVKARLAQAGLSLNEQTFWIASAIAGVTAGAIALLVTRSPIWSGAALFIFGLGLPRWIVGFLINGRQKKFVNQLADALDIITRGVKSGLPLNQCLKIVAAESPEPLRSEFQLVVDGQAMGVDLSQNMQRLYERMPLPEVNFFNIVLIIQQKTGGNLSESLGNLSAVLRSRKLLGEKVKALSSEAKASAGIIGSLPFIVMGLVYMVRPDYIGTLFVHPSGNLLLLISAVMMTSGILIMRNMVNFKF